MEPWSVVRPSLGSLVERRYGRRGLLLGAASALPMLAACRGPRGARRTGATRFAPVPPSSGDDVVVPEGHVAEVLLSWGDPLVAGAPPFDPAAQSAARQRLQFGFNCDWNGFLPLVGRSSEEGLLCVNHESVSPGEMFGGDASGDEARERFEIQLAAHGMSIAHVVRDREGIYRVRVGAPLARRVTGETPMRFDGPAAGSDLLGTSGDPSGRRPVGMLGNCGGGRTPWGTVLTCEENFDEYFANVDAAPDAEFRAALRRYDVKNASVYGFEAFDPRFDVAREPNEPHRFGWVVEIDPFDPSTSPVKHTALGRVKHEAAATTLAKDGRAVVYTADDEEFEYVYKFTSDRVYRPDDRAANRALLASGTLHVAVFEADGTGRWVPLVPVGPLADWSPARIAVHTRAAADLVGATPMDRPEDFEVGPGGRAYVCLTKNTKRENGDGAANPRARNASGHVVEIEEDGGDPGSTRFRWNVLALFGDPAVDASVSWAGCDGAAPVAAACPDNVAVDRSGDLWIATDGQPSAIGTNDALWFVPSSGEERGVPRRFLTGPIGAEITGPEFAPDERTLFLSIQHPGEGGGLATPTSSWPHDGTGVPRPSVVTVRRRDGERLT
ncbi:MAG: PhoX family phosphatase [Planctomycetota bacterium]